MKEGQVPGFLRGEKPGEKKDSGIARVLYVQTMGAPAWQPRDYATFGKEGYMENAIVFRCVRLIAEAAKAIPLLVYNGDQPVDMHPFLELLEYPNPFEPSADILDDIYSYLCIAGNTYLEQVSYGSVPAELYVLRPDRMKVVPGPKGRPASYTYCIGGSEVSYPVPAGGGQMTILHMKTFHPLNDWYGLSPMEPAAKSIDTHNAASAFNAALLQNMGRPSGALVVKSGDDNQLSNEQFDRLTDQIRQQVGPMAAGKPLLLEGGLEWVPFSQTPQDMEFSQGKDNAARDIASAFGVPPQMIGIPGDNTYANLKEANVAFYRQTIIPVVVKVCQSLSVFFRPTWGPDFKVWFDIDEVTGLVAEREEKWTMVNAATQLTVNEKREAIGYQDRDEGDVILINSSQLPLDENTGDPAGEIDPLTGLPIPPVDPNADPNADPAQNDPAGNA